MAQAIVGESNKLRAGRGGAQRDDGQDDHRHGTDERPTLSSGNDFTSRNTDRTMRRKGYAIVDHGAQCFVERREELISLLAKCRRLRQDLAGTKGSGSGAGCSATCKYAN